MAGVKVQHDKVAAYLRWSTDDQGEGFTLDTQTEVCRRVIAENGWTWNPALIYVDDGHSGTTLDRPAMNKLRADISDGRITCVVTYRLDRLSRNQRDSLSLQDEWEDACHVIAVSESINTLREPESTKYWGLMAWLGQIDRDRLVGNMKAGKYSAARKGSNPGGRAPYGYRTVGERGNKRFIVEESEAVIVRRIFSEYLGGRGTLTIAADLIADSVPSPMKNVHAHAEWSQRTVGRILSNEAYVGRFMYGREIVNPKHRRNPSIKRLRKNDDTPVIVDDVFPPIINREDFDAARRMRERRADKSARNRSARSQYLLTGIIRCAKCNAPVAGSRSRVKKSYVYEVYLCTGRKSHKTDCDCVSVKRADLEELVLQRVRAKFSVENRERIIADVASVINAKEREAQTVIETIRRELNDNQAKKRRWIAAFENGVDTNVFNERIAELRIEEASISARLASAETLLASIRKSSPETDVAMIVGAAQKFDEWDTLSTEQRKQVLRRLVKAIRVYAGPDDVRTLSITYLTDVIADA